MDLFNPESGLVIWMLVVFLLVLFVLAKFAFPVISKSLSERELRINNALKVADEAEAKLAHVEEERRKILAEAKEAQQEAINEVKAQKKQWLETARAEAQAEANKIVAEARASIEAEKQQALKEVRNEVAKLSVEIAGKVLRHDLESDEAQMALVNKIMEEDAMLN